MNLLIGAVSTNYTPEDIKNWVLSSSWDDCERVLLVYNSASDPDRLTPFLQQHNVTVIKPDFDFWGNKTTAFHTNTAHCNLETSYNLIHNLRFFHIWNFLSAHEYDKVLITDVKDVYFNEDPFPSFPDNKLTVTNENIIYTNDAWNTEHLHYNLGTIGLQLLLEQYVYNVGVFGGSYEIVKNLCADIYLLSAGKHKVADQTSFNYLIQTRYKNITNFTSDIAAHLHVVSTGLAAFDFEKINEYKIIHQYDRIPELKHFINKLYA